MVSRQRRTARRALFHQQGWGSLAPVDPINQQQFPGLESPDRPEYDLPRWEDLPAEGQGNIKGRHQIAAEEKEAGRSYRSMRGRANEMLDRAMERSQREGRSHPQGQDWYATERGRISERARNWGITDEFSPQEERLAYEEGGLAPSGGWKARQQNVEPQKAIGMVAATSPQVRWFERPSTKPEGRHTNIDVAEQVAYQEMNRTSAQPLSTSTGTRQNAEKAANILEGVDPNEVLGGSKVRSFNQNLQRPFDPRNRSTVDRHMLGAVGGFDPESSEATNFIQRKGRYEMVDRAIRSAAEARGLAPEEAQSVIWHQYKAERGDWGDIEDEYTKRPQAPQEESLFNGDQFSRQRRR